MNKERSNALRCLKTARGQISNQIMASNALLKKANLHILSGHLESCVKTAISSQNDVDEKLKEIEQLLAKVLK